MLALTGRYAVNLPICDMGREGPKAGCFLAVGLSPAFCRAHNRLLFSPCNHVTSAFSPIRLARMVWYGGKPYPPPRSNYMC